VNLDLWPDSKRSRNRRGGVWSRKTSKSAISSKLQQHKRSGAY